MKKSVSFFALLLLAVGAFSQPKDTGTDALQPLDIEGDRNRIQSERARIEVRYQPDVAACYARFAVTDCLRKVRVRQREALDTLRRQEIAINDAERKRKGLEQLERIKEKSSAQRLEEQAASRVEAQKAQQEREERASQKASASGTVKPDQPTGPREKKSAEQIRTADDIAKEQQQFNDKLRQAQERRESREKINKEKAGTGSKPLLVAP